MWRRLIHTARPVRSYWSGVDSEHWTSVANAVRRDDYINKSFEGISKHKVPALSRPHISHLPNSNIESIRIYREKLPYKLPLPNTLKILNIRDKVMYGTTVIDQAVYLNNMLLTPEIHHNLYKRQLDGLDSTYSLCYTYQHIPHLQYLAPLLKQLSLRFDGFDIGGNDINDLDPNKQMALFQRYSFTEHTMLFHTPYYLSYTYNGSVYYSSSILNIVQLIKNNQLYP